MVAINVLKTDMSVCHAFECQTTLVHSQKPGADGLTVRSSCSL